MKNDLPAYCYRRRRGNDTYIYYEKRGQKSVRLMEKPGTPAFAREYARVLSGVEVVQDNKKNFKELINRYFASESFTSKAPRTQADYKKHMTFIQERMGPLPVAGLQYHHVIRLRDDNAARVREANYLVQVMRILMKHAKELGWRKDNPAEGVGGLQTPKDKAQPHVVWTDEAVARMRAEALPKALLIMELGIATVQRPEDLTKIKWGDYDGTTITLTQGKTKKKLTLPVTERLKQMLDIEKAKLFPHPMRHILTNDTGGKLTYRRMAEIFLAERNRVGTREHDLHALRYRGVQELAWAGCSDEEIAGYSGHDSLDMIKKYAGEARQIMRARQAKVKRK
jgi:integrase